MDCNSGLRKTFADEVVKAVESIAQKYKLQGVQIERHDPMIVATRGCLQQEGVPQEKIEMVVLLSSNLQQAELNSSLSSAISEPGIVVSSAQVYRSFDISEAVAQETALGNQKSEPESECDDYDSAPS